LIAGALSILWAKSSGHFNESTWHITISKIVATFGFVLACATMNVGARYFAMCVFTIGTYGVNSILLAWVGNTCGQTREKKASALALANVSATLSLIWTPVSIIHSLSLVTITNSCSTSGPNLTHRGTCCRSQAVLVLLWLVLLEFGLCGGCWSDRTGRSGRPIPRLRYSMLIKSALELGTRSFNLYRFSMLCQKLMVIMTEFS
jgi:hypothetical protein